MNKVTNVELIGEVVVITTEGYLNKDLGEEIQNSAQEHITNGKNKVLINFIGASILIELIEQLQEKDGSLAFCGLAPIIEKTFKIMGLTKYCESFTTQDEAVAAM